MSLRSRRKRVMGSGWYSERESSAKRHSADSSSDRTIEGRRRRFDGTGFENFGSVGDGKSSRVRQSHEHNIFPVAGRGRTRGHHPQPGTAAGGIQAGRSVRKNRQCEPTGRANPYKLALELLKHLDRQLSGAAHRGRSTKK